MRGGFLQRGIEFLRAVIFLESRQTSFPVSSMTIPITKGRFSSSPEPSKDHCTLIISACESFLTNSERAFLFLLFTVSMYALFRVFRLSAITIIYAYV